MVSIFSCKQGKIEQEPIKTHPKLKQKKLITVPINLSNGFLILDRKSNPKVETWAAKYSRILKDGPINISQFDQKTKSKNYFKVPEKLYKDKDPVQVTLSGYHNNLEIVQSSFIVNENNFAARCPGCNWELACEVTCVGPDYAYIIRAYSPPNGGQFYLSVSETASCDDQGYNCVPYYYYVPNQPNLPDYGDNISDAMITTQHPEQDFCTASGSHISGTVWGIAKGLGQWDGLDLTTNYLIGEPPCAENNIQSFLNILNLSSNGTDLNSSNALNCGSTPCGNISGGSGTGGLGGDPCNLYGGLSFGPQDDFWDTWSSGWGCNGFVNVFEDEIEKVTFNDQDSDEDENGGTTSNPIIIDFDKIRTAGSSLPELTFNEGLYFVEATTKKGKFKIYTEIPKMRVKEYKLPSRLNRN